MSIPNLDSIVGVVGVHRHPTLAARLGSLTGALIPLTKSVQVSASTLGLAVATRLLYRDWEQGQVMEPAPPLLSGLRRARPACSTSPAMFGFRASAVRVLLSVLVSSKFDVDEISTSSGGCCPFDRRSTIANRSVGRRSPTTCPLSYAAAICA